MDLSFPHGLEVLLVVGLPASGKTTWARRRAELLQSQGRLALVLDDPREVKDVLSALADLDRLQQTASTAQAPVLLVTDPSLCDPEVRKLAQGWWSREVPQACLDWHFFANNPQQAQANARARGLEAKPVEQAIVQWSRLYQPPESALPIPVASLALPTK